VHERSICNSRNGANQNDRIREDIKEENMLVINEKYGVVLDPDTLIVGVSRPGFYKVNLAPIEKQITVLEAAVNDLFNTLDPTSNFRVAQPHREGMLSKAGFTTFFMLGLTFGVLAVAIVFIALGGA
jgi:tetrahydromethanopterin S-methyltransferase subunit B